MVITSRGGLWDLEISFVSRKYFLCQYPVSDGLGRVGGPGGIAPPLPTPGLGEGGSLRVKNDLDQSSQGPFLASSNNERFFAIFQGQGPLPRNPPSASQ